MAIKCSKTFGATYFSTITRPIETVIVNGQEFYYIYEYDKQAKLDKLINKKIPNAEHTIRQFYTLLIFLIERGNKLGKRGAWKAEKVKRWIMRQLKRKVKYPKQFEDFIDAIELTDKEAMISFLAGDLFKCEELLL